MNKIETMKKKEIVEKGNRRESQICRKDCNQSASNGTGRNRGSRASLNFNG